MKSSYIIGCFERFWSAFRSLPAHLEVRVLHEVGEPLLRVEGDGLEELLVEQVEDDAVAGELQERLEGGLEVAEALRFGGGSLKLMIFYYFWQKKKKWFIFPFVRGALAQADIVKEYD